MNGWKLANSAEAADRLTAGMVRCNRDGVARSRIRIRGFFLVTGAVALMGVTIALVAVGVGPRFTYLSGTDSASIPSSSLKRGELRFFSYRDDAGKEIRFILGRDDAGQVRGAFDACRRCAQYGKGFTSSHGYLVCRYCGNRYKIDSAPTGTSCTPLRLPVRENGEAINVDATQLERQRNLF